LDELHHVSSITPSSSSVTSQLLCVKKIKLQIGLLLHLLRIIIEIASFLIDQENE